MLLITSEHGKRKKHHHVIYKGDSVLQMNEGDHQHPLIFDEEGNVVVGKGGKDNHTHEVIGELEGSALEPEKKKDPEVIAQVHSSFKAAEAINSRSRQQAAEADKMIDGEQYSQADKDRLESEERACLTFNFIERKLDSLSGTQRLNKGMSQYAPEEGGDQFTADIYNIILKNIARNTDWDSEETDIFEDASGPGQGVYDIYVDTDNNIEGDIVVERFDWKNILFGPHSKIDGSDCEYFVKRKVITFDRLASEYPEKEKQIKNMVTALNNHSNIFEEASTTVNDYPVSQSGSMYLINDEMLVDIEKQEITILELNIKVFKKKHTVVYAKDNFFLAYEGLDQKTVSMVKDIPGISVIDQPTNWIQKVKIAGSVVLDNEIKTWPSGDPVKEFHTVPVYTKKRGNFWHGKVYSVADIQRLLNKVQSLIADHAARSVSNTTYYTGETFSGLPTEEENFIDNNGKAGLVVKVSDINQKPHKEEPGRIPSDLFSYQETLLRWMDILMAIDETPQTGGRAESGKALAEKERIGLKANERIFDNMDKSRRCVVKIIAKYIQEYYTPARIVRIVGQDILSEDPTIIDGQELAVGDEGGQDTNGQPLSAEAMFQAKLGQIAQMLQDPKLLSADLAVVNSTYSQTQRELVFSQMMQLRMQGMDIPASVLSSASNWPQSVKNELNKTIAAQSKAQAEQEKAKNQTEIAKTVLAKINLGESEQ